VGSRLKLFAALVGFVASVIGIVIAFYPELLRMDAPTPFPRFEQEIGTMDHARAYARFMENNQGQIVYVDVWACDVNISNEGYNFFWSRFDDPNFTPSPDFMMSARGCDPENCVARSEWLHLFHPFPEEPDDIGYYLFELPAVELHPNAYCESGERRSGGYRWRGYMLPNERCDFDHARAFDILRVASGCHTTQVGAM